MEGIEVNALPKDNGDYWNIGADAETKFAARMSINPSSMDKILKQRKTRKCPKMIGCVVSCVCTVTAMALAAFLVIGDLRPPSPRCQDAEENCVNGECTGNFGGTWSCLCAQGWSGPACTIDRNECAEYDKLCDHGECKNFAGGYKCDCDVGWGGDSCSEEIDECRDPNTYCQQGECTNTVGSYNCSCFQGWSGRKCNDGPCRPEYCKLPKCRCPGLAIPGDIPVEETPIMVYLTFDDGIRNADNLPLYEELQSQAWKNPNGCPAKFTFFVSSDNWNAEATNKVYNMGHEMASHSLTHKFPTKWWLTATYDEYVEEIVGMRNRLVREAGVPGAEITGMRCPFLAAGSNSMFQMLKDNSFEYDSSLLAEKLSWPFTLDFDIPSTYCWITGTCPTRPFPGLWEMPLNLMKNGEHSCGMTDETVCGSNNGVQGVQDYLRRNFDRHVENNRVPFIISLHSPWFSRQGGSMEALKGFMSDMHNRTDVWLLSHSQILDWVRHPMSVLTRDDWQNVPASWKC